MERFVKSLHGPEERMKRFTVELRDAIHGSPTFAVVLYDDLQIFHIRDALENEREFLSLSIFDQKLVTQHLFRAAFPPRWEFWRELERKMRRAA